MIDPNILSYCGNVVLAGGLIADRLLFSRRVYQKQLVKQLKDLVEVQARRTTILEKQNALQQRELDTAFAWIEYLEEIVGENPELVRERSVSRKQRLARPVRTENPPNPDNG